MTANELAELKVADCFERQLPRRFDIRTKLVYGSDWMMSVGAQGHRRFVERFAEVFSGVELGPWRDDFFCKNAGKILGLDTSICSPR